jgi:hypothetical protein
MRLKGQKTKSQISAQICGWVHYLPFRKKNLGSDFDDANG